MGPRGAERRKPLGRMEKLGTRNGEKTREIADSFRRTWGPAMIGSDERRAVTSHSAHCDAATIETILEFIACTENSKKNMHSVC